jgi:hypothetical protein
MLPTLKSRRAKIGKDCAHAAEGYNEYKILVFTPMRIASLFAEKETLRYDPTAIDRDLIDLRENRPEKKSDPALVAPSAQPNPGKIARKEAKSARVIDRIRENHAKKLLAGKMTADDARRAEERLGRLMESPIWSSVLEWPFSIFVFACLAAASVAGSFGGPILGLFVGYGLYHYAFGVPKAAKSADDE